MSAVPTIPAEIVTAPQLDLWIDEQAPMAVSPAARMRLIAVVIERAAEIGARQRAMAVREGRAS